ncbi:MAG: hypothetical protein J6V50_04955 [Clostridia bacterium]|nr:hypothetical protein [Clostridia bacterium]
MRELRDYKAEIFARSEKRIKAQRTKRIRTLAVVLSLCVVLVFVGAFMVSEKLFVGFNSAIGDSENADAEDEIGNAQLLKFISFSVSNKNSDVSVDDPEKTAKAYLAVSELFGENDGGDLSDFDNKIDTSTENESIGDYGYIVCFEAADGQIEKYMLTENMLYNLQSGATTALTENQLCHLKGVLGIVE